MGTVSGDTISGICLFICLCGIIAEGLTVEDVETNELSDFLDKRRKIQDELDYLDEFQTYQYGKRYSNNWNPWQSLPRTFCFRKRCRTDRDCCQRFNICEPNARICHDCWYGYPCQMSSDCCQRFPNCDFETHKCTR